MRVVNNRFKISLDKQQLTFCAAHFITYGANICESLHGHNWRVACEVEGDVNEHGYVVDFIALRDKLQELVTLLDHKVLLPLEHPSIRVENHNGQIIATFSERRWEFPESDCALLPLDNTTAERLAEYIGDQLAQWLGEHAAGLHSLRVAVDENQGQWGIHERSIST